MNEVTKYHLADLEYCLSIHLRPTFLMIVHEEETNEIHLVISCIQFKNKTIQKRIAGVFNLINKYIPAIINEYLIVVSAYDGPEIEEYLDHVFDEEIND